MNYSIVSNKNNIIFCLILFSFLVLKNFCLNAQTKYDSSRFNLLESFRGIGGMGNTLVGPGENERLEYVYTTHSSIPLQVIATDVNTGNSIPFTSPLDSEKEAYAITLGVDNKIYIGTSPNGHLMRVNWKTKTLEDLGIAIRGEQYIWRIIVGSDNNIYGCTYPNAKLFRYNIVKDKFEDLGRMDSDEMYAHSIGADKNGFIYVGIGYSKCHLVAYEIATGKFKDILPDECKIPGYCLISKGNDGRIYATAGSGKYYLSISRWQTSIINEKTFVNAKDNLKLKNGNKIEVGFKDNTIQIFDSYNQKVRKFDIKNNETKLNIFRIGLGPDNNLYGGTELPFNFFKINLQNNTISNIGRLGDGEAYSFIPFEGKLIILTYTSLAPIMIYDPSKDFNPLYTKNGNPYLISSHLISPTWRPYLAIMNENKKIYIGSMNEYGKKGGALTIFDPKRNNIEVFNNIMGNQSIFSLCNLLDGNVLGGTYNQGGMGSRITEKEAKIFIWNTKINKKIFEMVPVPRRRIVNAVITGENGLVYGFAGDTFFIFNPNTKRIIKSEKHKLGGIIYNALGIVDDIIYGVSSHCVFRINQQKNIIEILDKYNKQITGGFSILDDKIYFTSGSDIISYSIR